MGRCGCVVPLWRIVGALVYGSIKFRAGVNELGYHDAVNGGWKLKLRVDE